MNFSFSLSLAVRRMRSSPCSTVPRLGIRPVLGVVYERADQSLRRELGRTSIADVLRDCP